MARAKKTEIIEEVENVTKSVEEKAPKKKVSNNTLNKDGFVKGKALTPEEYAKFKAKYK